MHSRCLRCIGTGSAINKGNVEAAQRPSLRMNSAEIPFRVATLPSIRCRSEEEHEYRAKSPGREGD